MSNSKVTIILDDKYEVGVGLGCWLRSREIAERGTVRFLAGHLMYSYKVYPRRRFSKNWGTWWTPVDKSLENFEAFRAWKAGL